MVTFSRSSDISGKTDGKTILYINMSERFLFNDMSKIYNVDSLNLKDEDIREQCEEIIKKLRQEFGQTRDAQVYQEETYGNK